MKTKILSFAILASLFYGCNWDYEKFKKLKKANLTFEKLKVDNKTIYSKQLLAQIQGKEKEGFIIKSIAISDSEIAKVEGTKPYFSITIKKAGTFTATIILEKDEFLDVKIENCEFDIKTFTFSKLKISNGRTTITKNELLKQIRGLSGLGYQIKNITISDSDKAEILGNKLNFKIKIKQFGNFTATIILEKSGFLDVELNNCEFEIKKPNLSFQKITITNGKNVFSTQEILAEIRGLTNLDYQIKNITISDSDKAEVQGTKPNFKITIKQFGNFTATIILEKSGFLDAKIENCEFEIKEPNLTFQKITITNGKNVFSTQEILAKIQGEKAGYQIKNITILDSDKAEVLGTKPNFSIKIKKAGNFTAKIILEKSGFLDAKIANCEFEIKKPNLTFQKITITNGKNVFSTQEILAKIQGQKDGYTLKSIAVSNSEIAEVAGTKPYFSIKIKKVGTFTATIIFERSGFLDVEIHNCEFSYLFDFTYGGSRYDEPNSIIETADGNLVVAGYTNSKGAGWSAFWVLKLDNTGNKIWEKTYGVSGYDGAKSIIETLDGNLVVAGDTSSKGAGSYDFWILKLDNTGNKIWEKTYDSKSKWVNSIIETSDGNLAVAGYTDSKGVNDRDMWILKLYGNDGAIFGSR